MHWLDRSERPASTLGVALVLAIASIGTTSVAASTRSIPIGLAGIATGLVSATAATSAFAFATFSPRWLLSALAVGVPLIAGPWTMSGHHLVEVGAALGRTAGTGPAPLTAVVESLAFVAFLISAASMGMLAIVIPVRLAVFGRGLRGVDNGAAASWSREPAARLLRIMARLCLPADLALVKVEEWCAELAAIESGWERTVHLIDVLGDMHKAAGAARSRGPGGRP